jgi:hypothetical protein
MFIYNVTGSILIEGTSQEADYDFEMEYHTDEYPPNEMEVLHYMMQAGIIQILHDDAELVGEDEDE